MGYRRFHDHESDTRGVCEVQARILEGIEDQTVEDTGHGVRNDKVASQVGGTQVQENILDKEVHW
jgi:hypothetical protein